MTENMRWSLRSEHTTTREWPKDRGSESSRLSDPGVYVYAPVDHLQPCDGHGWRHAGNWMRPDGSLFAQRYLHLDGAEWHLLADDDSDF